MNKKLKEKIYESLAAVLPVTLIVFALCVTITPMPLATLMMFLVGAVPVSYTHLDVYKRQQDRRVSRVCLTRQGHALLKQAYHAMNEKLDSALAALGKQDAALLFTLLNKFTAQLEQAAGIEWEES